MVRTRSGKGVYDVLESSNRPRVTFRPPVPPPSPPRPAVSLEQLFASHNAIMQRLAEIDERQSGRSLQCQQPQESSCLDFLVTHTPMFAKTTYLLEANHWLHVTESKFGLIHYSEFQKTLFAAQ
jgi:hypothetical protein